MLLDAIFEDKGVSKQGGSTTLATKGCQKLVTVGNCIKNKPNPEYTIDNLSWLQVSRNLSDNDTKAIASFLRVKGGRKCVEANLLEGLRGRNHKLKDMFLRKDMMIKEKPKKKKSTDYSCESDCYDGNQEGNIVDGTPQVK